MTRLDFHLVQLFFALMPSLGIICELPSALSGQKIRLFSDRNYDLFQLSTWWLYARREMRKMEAVMDCLFN